MRARARRLGGALRRRTLHIFGGEGLQADGPAGGRSSTGATTTVSCGLGGCGAASATHSIPDELGDLKFLRISRNRSRRAAAASAAPPTPTRGGGASVASGRRRGRRRRVGGGEASGRVALEDALAAARRRRRSTLPLHASRVGRVGSASAHIDHLEFNAHLRGSGADRRIERAVAADRVTLVAFPERLPSSAAATRASRSVPSCGRRPRPAIARGRIVPRRRRRRRRRMQWAPLECRRAAAAAVDSDAMVAVGERSSSSAASTAPPSSPTAARSSGGSSKGADSPRPERKFFGHAPNKAFTVFVAAPKAPEDLLVACRKCARRACSSMGRCRRARRASRSRRPGAARRLQRWRGRCGAPCSSRRLAGDFRRVGATFTDVDLAHRSATARGLPERRRARAARDVEARGGARPPRMGVIATRCGGRRPPRRPARPLDRDQLRVAVFGECVDVECWQPGLRDASRSAMNVHDAARAERVAVADAPDEPGGERWRTWPWT